MIRQPSLRRLLLIWLLPAMLALVAAGGLMAYGIALRSATWAYDRALLDTSLALSGQIHIVSGHPVLNLPSQAQEILLTDRYDNVFYEVIGPQGESVAGHRGIPRPPQQLPEDGRIYYDGWFHDREVRVAALFVLREGIPLLILAAETQTKRDNLVREILTSMLLPELLLVAATLGLGWLGIRHGLKPVEDLREQLSQRSHHDLSAVSSDRVPREIGPLVEELNHLLSRLDGSLSAQRNFVSDAAHQLRTPLAALQAQAELALRRLNGPAPTQTGELRAELERILAATRRLTHLAHQLLALARAEPGGEQAMKPLDLVEVVHQCAETWHPRALEHNIDLGFDLAPAPLLGHPRLLEELLSNLIDNAIHYTPAGGSVTVRTFARDGAAVLQVDDTGPGIAPEQREKVFERFHRINGEQNPEGCGLGLAIVREIAKQHGADVWLDEAPVLGGARLEVSFPPPPGR
ncbi:sensor histidine kinase [Azospira sp.]|uniref:sensor histidine kinase n=1 Tax=Azospira sp. TaxID=1872671 RepID=UPI00255FC814|nr:sensor histidine kinase [Azospira sp.]MDK9689757.1 sensor histidine kinase [Azospira sp.]